MTEPIGFTGSLGQHLAASIDRPDGTVRGWALFAHCFSCGKDSIAASRVSRALARRGIGVLRFDVTGLGGSTGSFTESTFSCDVSDLTRAAEVLQETGQAPFLLVGHSLGGAAVLAAAARIPQCRAVATIGAPGDPAHVADLIDPQEQDRIEADGSAQVVLAGRAFTIQRSFLRDIAEQPQARRIASLHRALLVLHAPTDAIVGIENARFIFDTAHHPKSFVALDGADHLLTRRTDADFVAAGWRCSASGCAGSGASRVPRAG